MRPGHGEVRDAAILQCDIRRFTGLAMRLPPDEVMRLLAEYEARMVSVIQRHGGSIDKFMGDGILVTFGAAVRSETYAADALRATGALVEAAAAWRREREAAGLEPLDIHFAVAVGPVVFAHAVGDETRLEYTVIGDAVNLAAKLEKHNKVEGTRALTTAACRDRASEQGFILPADATVRTNRAVEGISSAVDLVVLAA